ncbi:hypothetical protein SAMN05444483_11926 [Salegentibacter echinorum]|uniref:Uncharacterized protein n=1 Tax=Salegentibacter echinorum TaxID=1073325 RepID=A0A1M5LD89_SALEC|nr:hypothetical protein SAMN05444483_11926 [Salegentibacter echinorum]
MGLKPPVVKGKLNKIECLKVKKIQKQQLKAETVITSISIKIEKTGKCKNISKNESGIILKFNPPTAKNKKT